MAEDNDGTLWIGTTDGLVSYRQHSFHRITSGEGLPDMKVWRLVGARSGGLWIQAGYDVVMFENGKFSPRWWLGSGVRPQVLSLAQGGDDWLNIFTPSAWLRLSPKADELRTNYQAALIPLFSILPSNQSDNSAWLGTEQGLRHLEQGNLKSAGAEELSHWLVDFLYQDRGGNLWAGVRRGGLYRRDGERWSEIDLGNGFYRGSIVSMTEDREGNLWLGTDQGLVQLLPQRVRAYTARDGLADDYVWSVCEGADGVIWVATDHGLNRIRAGRVLAREVGERNPNSPDRCIWPNGTGGVWIAKQDYDLLEFQNGVFARSDEAQTFPSLVNALFKDRSDRLWVGMTEVVCGHSRTYQNERAHRRDGAVACQYSLHHGRPGGSNVVRNARWPGIKTTG